MQSNRRKVDFTPSGKEVIHGRASSYNNHKCGCAECKSAWAKYMHPRLKEYRARRRKQKKVGVQIKV